MTSLNSLNASTWRSGLSKVAKAAGLDGLAQCIAPTKSKIEIEIDGPLTAETREQVLSALKTVLDMSKPEDAGVNFKGHHDGQGMSIVGDNGAFSAHASLDKHSTLILKP